MGLRAHGFGDCCARAASGHVAAAPPSIPMNSCRFMSDSPPQPVCRTFSLPQGGQRVLRIGLNCSESTRTSHRRPLTASLGGGRACLERAAEALHGRWFDAREQTRDLHGRPLAPAGRRNAASVQLRCNGPQRLTAGRLSSFTVSVRSDARACALARWAALPAARAFAVSLAPRSPPSFTPRRLAAAKAAFVRAEIMSASSLGFVRPCLPQVP